MKLSFSLLFAGVALLAASCGGSKRTADSTPQAPKQQEVRVYFLQGGKLVTASRNVQSDAPQVGALAALGGPLTQQERSGGFTSDVHGDFELGATRDQDVTVDRVDGPTELSGPALAQVVYTLTQFPHVETVNGHGRSEFEDLTPPILVESPVVGQTVHSPLRVTGSANTFEATFQYELRGEDGRILAKHFVTATSGNGHRGTFEFTAKFDVARKQPGTLVVYEDDAAGGGRVHIREIPLNLT